MGQMALCPPRHSVHYAPVNSRGDCLLETVNEVQKGLICNIGRGSLPFPDLLSSVLGIIHAASNTKILPESDCLCKYVLVAPEWAMKLDSGQSVAAKVYGGSEAVLRFWRKHGDMILVTNEEEYGQL